ncbi:MAG TPA: hypothetical protein VNY52_12560, partial [Solirubrobacteraceae bacterium]|nr:hypothetical protein [Solirubrobacteraceae bacterium]
GGFPTVGESAKCNGDACQGQSSVPPSLSAPGSISEHGGENLTAFAGTNFMSTPKPKATHKHKYKHKTKKKAKKSSIFIKANR